MGILDRFGFGGSGKKETGSSFEGEPQASTSEELLRLSESNQQVAAELAEFEEKVRDLKQQAEMGGGMRPEDWNIVKNEAKASSEALSGYGIIVTAEAFLDL